MLDFKAKMHQIWFLLELRSDLAGGAHNAPLDPQVAFEESYWKPNIWLLSL